MIYRERTSPAGLAPSEGASPAVREAAVQLRRDMIEQQVWQCCINCINWEKLTIIDEQGVKTEVMRCGKYAAVPPPEVLVVGCVEYERDIPF